IANVDTADTATYYCVRID
nr:immunoglobulin heavy chain junction region [Mus musculus]